MNARAIMNGSWTEVGFLRLVGLEVREEEALAAFLLPRLVVDLWEDSAAFS